MVGINIGIAHQMHGMTILALLQRMVLDELVPVFPLIRSENSGAFTQRADAIEGGENGRTNKLRSIRNVSHSLAEGIVDLERDDIVLTISSHGKCLPKTSLSYTIFTTVRRGSQPKSEKPKPLLHCITFEQIGKALGSGGKFCELRVEPHTPAVENDAFSRKPRDGPDAINLLLV
jgi:hypothetical protein